MDASGNHVGYMAEQERGMGSMMARQWFRTHRSFVTHVFDKYENEVLRVCRDMNPLQMSMLTGCSSIDHFHGLTLIFESTTRLKLQMQHIHLQPPFRTIPQGLWHQ